MIPHQLGLPKIPIGEWAEAAVSWIKQNLGDLITGLRRIGENFYEGLAAILTTPTPLVMVAIFALLAWFVRSWKLAIGTAITMLLIVNMDQWTNAMLTLALVLVATITTLVIAVPAGVLAAKSSTFSAIIRPVLDFMQTMPAFVYLIPAIVFFSIGPVPGIFATIIFSMPPGVRLTELGIRQVDSETVEAGKSFGATPWQILKGIELPLAVPSIMAGVNQVIMLGLSMAVIAAMVGAEGLGPQVTLALGNVDVALGTEAGLSLVFLAVFLDRVTSALSTPSKNQSSLWALIKRARQRRAKQAAEQAA